MIKKFEKVKVKLKKTGIEHGTSYAYLWKKIVLKLLLSEKIFQQTEGMQKYLLQTVGKKDLKRRDFTINSIYLDQNGKIFDPHSGVARFK